MACVHPLDRRRRHQIHGGCGRHRACCWCATETDRQFQRAGLLHADGRLGRSASRPAAGSGRDHASSSITQKASTSLLSTKVKLGGGRVDRVSPKGARSRCDISRKTSSYHRRPGAYANMRLNGQVDGTSAELHRFYGAGDTGGHPTSSRASATGRCPAASRALRWPSRSPADEGSGGSPRVRRTPFLCAGACGMLSISTANAKAIRSRHSPWARGGRNPRQSIRRRRRREGQREHLHRRMGRLETNSADRPGEQHHQGHRGDDRRDHHARTSSTIRRAVMIESSEKTMSTSMICIDRSRRRRSP